MINGRIWLPRKPRPRSDCYVLPNVLKEIVQKWIRNDKLWRRKRKGWSVLVCDWSVIVCDWSVLLFKVVSTFVTPSVLLYGCMFVGFNKQNIV